MDKRDSFRLLLNIPEQLLSSNAQQRDRNWDWEVGWRWRLGENLLELSHTANILEHLCAGQTLNSPIFFPPLKKQKITSSIATLIIITTYYLVISVEGKPLAGDVSHVNKYISFPISISVVSTARPISCFLCLTYHYIILAGWTISGKSYVFHTSLPFRQFLIFSPNNFSR